MTRSRLRVTAIVAVVLPVALGAQQRDTTAKPAAPPAGTGAISGIVVAADASAQPLRRAVVTLTGAGLSARSVVSDDAGRFTFPRLAAGTYTATARKAAYLAAPYGARRPGRTGMPIVLADGQRADVRITMFRGAAITGTLRDASGQPIGGVDVRAIDARTLQSMADSSPAEVATSDDRGVFRIYTLLPGDYFVVALPSASGSGAIAAPSASSIDAALAMLAARRAPVGAAPAAPPPAGRPIGFSPVYFPGTPDYRGAVRVHVDAGEERAGVDFEVRSQPVMAIEAVVRGDVADMSRVQVTLIPSGPRPSTGMSSNSLSGRALDAKGTVRYENLPPGSYRLVARAPRGDVPGASQPVLNNRTLLGGVGGGGVSPTSVPVSGGTGTYVYGFADVELIGDDVTGVTLDLQPGGTISGRLAFTGASAPPTPDLVARMRASLSLIGGTGGMVSSGGLTMGDSLVRTPITTINPDGTFEIRGIGPGRFSLTFAFPTAAEAGAWKLRTATAAGRDLLDSGLELGPGIAIPNVVVGFSDARTEISGTLQTTAGEVTTEYYIVALPADRASWQPRSRRILSVRPATDGRFVFVDPPAGEYLLAALADLDPIDLQDVSFLEQIAPAAVKITVSEGERKIQDLRIR